MSAAHTPGPWEYEHFDGESFELKTTQPGEYEPIITGCGCCGSPRLSKDADGKLIAAAPELLEALQEMVDGDAEAIDEAKALGVPFPEEMLKAYRKAIAAIAKATGETQ